MTQFVLPFVMPFVLPFEKETARPGPTLSAARVAAVHVVEAGGGELLEHV